MLDIVNLPPDTPARPDGSRVGGWWHRQDDGRVVCLVVSKHYATESTGARITIEPR